MAEPALDFSALFMALPTPLLVLVADAASFRIAAANDAYLDATMTRRDEICGRPMFDVFPDNPADPTASGTRNLGASLERVRARGLPDVMPVQRYDIQRRRSVTGGFEERHWAPQNAPVLNGGKVTHILHRVEDVTALVRAGQVASSSQPPPVSRSTLRLKARSDLTMLRASIREACAVAGFGETATMDLVVAATELGTNALLHAGGGTVKIDLLGIDGPRALRLRFEDEGPGIQALDRVLAGGHSTAGTLGLGLSGSRKLVDELQVETSPRGTTVTITKWRRPSRR